MKKMKKAALIFGTGLCLAVGTGGTLAYLGDTGQVANRLTFAGEKGLDAVLTEPSWNPQKGLLTVPGSSVAKDPQIKICPLTGKIHWSSQTALPPAYRN